MGRPIRYMPEPHTIFEVTCRTIQGRYLLRPSKKLNDLVLGVIGRSAKRYPVKLYIFVVLSNHMHIILSAPDIQTLSQFMNFVNANIAKEAGRLYQWREKFWGRRYTAIPILDDKALMGRVRYILAHGCKERLVRHPKNWPGINCVKVLTEGMQMSGTWIDRTGLYNSNQKERNPKQFETSYEIRLAPIPCFARLSEQEQRNQWQTLVNEVESEFAKNCVGPKSVFLPQSHHCSLLPKRSPRPLCHVSTKMMRRFYREAYRLFVIIYRQAQDRLRVGDPSALSCFPPNCYIPPFALASFHPK